MEFAQTDFPLLVAPEIKQCGILVILIEIGSPLIAFPAGTYNFSFLLGNVNINSFKVTIPRISLGTSIPMVAGFPGMGDSILKEVAPKASLKSS